jgi:hypothetical protein
VDVDIVRIGHARQGRFPKGVNGLLFDQTYPAMMGRPEEVLAVPEGLLPGWPTLMANCHFPRSVAEG